MIHVDVRSDEIRTPELGLDRPFDGAGALDVFVGLVRNSSPQRPGTEVVRLEYEGYVPMAIRELETIARECKERHGALSVVILHRVGVLHIGEVAVAIAVWTGHRAAAFEGCRYVIEEIKKRVPIWKKEVFDDGSAWVHPHP